MKKKSVLKLFMKKVSLYKYLLFGMKGFLAYNSQTDEIRIWFRLHLHEVSEGVQVCRKEKQMKRRFMTMMLLASAAALCACHSADSNSSSVSSSAVSSHEVDSSSIASSAAPVMSELTPASDQVRQVLTNEGWNIREPLAKQFNAYGGVLPQSVIVAIRNGENYSISAAWFDSENTALDAYNHLAPHNGSTEEDLSEAGKFEEVWLTMPEGEGYWLIRRQGDAVFSVWSLESSRKEDMIRLLDAFGS